MMPPVRIPALIGILFFSDLALGAIYLITKLVASPSVMLTMLADLDGESNLPAWFSSVQLFSVAILLGIFAERNFEAEQKKSWLLAMLPLLFLALSLDEVAQIHEWLGTRSDILLRGGAREGSLFRYTGIWMFLIGLPFTILFMGLMFSLHAYFRAAPSALIKILLGMAIGASGALGIEALTNFVAPDSAYGVLQVFFEEMCELLGITVMLWGSYELLQKHGFVLGLEPIRNVPRSTGSRP